MANKILGIVNCEPRYVHVEGLGDHRPAAAASVLGRYRVIDFPMSNFSNSNIENIAVYIKSNGRSLIQHIADTNYNINSKRGSIRVVPSSDEHISDVLNTDLRALYNDIDFIEEDAAQYVVIAPSHFIYTEDYEKLVAAHVKSGNDITMLYQIVTNADTNFVNCDTLEITKQGKVKSIGRNLGKEKKAFISLETYVMSKKLLLDLIYAGMSISSAYSLRDTIYESFSDFKVGAVCHAASAYCISSLMAYYYSTMHIRKENEAKTLINDEWPIYTCNFDSCPTLYMANAEVKGSVIGNGCKIDGTVINSVIGRDVEIKKGAVIKDSVVLPNSLIDEDVHLEKVVVDKYAVVSHKVKLKGKTTEPVYVTRRGKI